MDRHCRACLAKCPRSVSIFSSPKLWGKNIAIAKLIMACAPIRILKNDGFPSKICEDCLKLLQLSFLFRLRVVASEEKLRSASKKTPDGIPQPLLLTAEWGGLDQVYSIDHIRRSAISERNYVDEEFLTASSEPQRTIPNNSIYAAPTNINLNQILNPEATENSNNISVANQNMGMVSLKSDTKTTATTVPNIVFINEQNQQINSISSTAIPNSATNVFQAYEIIPLANNTSTTEGGSTMLGNLLSTDASADPVYPTAPLSSFQKIGTTDNTLVLDATDLLADLSKSDALGAALQLQIQDVVGSYEEPLKMRPKIETPKQEIDKSTDDPINIDLTGDEDALLKSSDEESTFLPRIKQVSDNPPRTIEDIVIDDGCSSTSSKRLSTDADNDKDDEPVKKKKKIKTNVKKPLKIDEALIIIDD